MKTPRWSRLQRWCKRGLFAVVALVTLVALVLAIEGHRARRAWDACQREFAARGEALGWQAQVATPVPAESNLLATPLLAPCFGWNGLARESAGHSEEGGPCVELLPLSDWTRRLPGAGDWRSAAVVPLEAWQTELRSTNVLDGARFVYGLGDPPRLAERYGVSVRTMQRPGTAGSPGRPSGAPPPTAPNDAAGPPGESAAQTPRPPESGLTNAHRYVGGSEAVHGEMPLPSWAELWSRPPASAVEDLRFLLGRHRAQLDEIRAAARRPYAQLRLDPSVLSESLMTRFAALKGLAQPFRVSAWTELTAGNPELAATELETVFALSDAASSQPLLIGALVRIAMVDLAVQPIWAGLAERRWQDPQLARLEARLARVNIVEDVQRCLRGERAFALAMLTAAPDSGDPQPGLPQDSLRQVLRRWPRAFVYRNQINIARAYQQVLLDRLDPGGPSVRWSLATEDQALRKRYGAFSPYNLFAPQLLQALEKSLEKAAASQATITLARVACALERYRLARDRYPETLGELSPEYLAVIPPDPVDGGPLRYRRDGPDRFTLYSVGLDGRDDGGVAGAIGRGAPALPAPTGDWVWLSQTSAIASPE